MYELTGISPQKFKQAVKMKMIRRDMTVAELADFIGYSRQSVYNFLSEGNWNRFMAAELMEKLDIRMEDLKDD